MKAAHDFVLFVQLVELMSVLAAMTLFSSRLQRPQPHP